MTQEEKARAYDEALERARALRQEAIDKEYAIDYVKDYEAIFPELAESEDERIRKKIIENVRLSGGYTDEEIDEMISWLEKQKEEADERLERVEQFRKEVQELGEEMASLRKKIYGDEQKEQKPAEWEDYKDKVNIPYCSSEPEWSEEDKNKIERLAFLVSVVEEKEMISPSESIDLRNFIKSLRPKQKQEWSEEDENARQNLIAHFEGKVLRLSDEAKKEAVDWLKSLRPSWKPSEEQMRFLLAVINEPNNAGSESCHLVLKELYEQLKTL